jgi:Uma2 family endonuclease
MGSMTWAKTRPRKTIEDLYRLPPETRAELIDGEIYLSPAPSPRHLRISRTLLIALHGHVSGAGLGEFLDAPVEVLLPGGEVVQPDLIFIPTAKEFIVQDRIRGVPDLIIEIVSPGAPERDRIVKRDLYLRNGVREYWIVDDATRSVEVFSPQGAAWFEEGDELISAVLPALRLRVATMFA